MSRPAMTAASTPAQPGTASATGTAASRVPLIIGAAVLALAVIGVGGYYGYRMLFSGDSAGRTASSEPPVSTAPVTEPPTGAAPQSPPQDATSMQSTPTTPPASELKSAAKDVPSVTPDTTKAPGATTSAKDSSKSQAAKSASSSSTGGATPPATETPKAAVPARGPTDPQQTAQPNRWQQMKEAMSRCSGETFFKRVACEQAVGLQYCEGYWGKVPQCPSGPTKDRGQ